MVRQVDDLLDVSRISRGKIELRKEQVELAPVVNHALETIRPLGDSLRHEITVTLPPKPLYRRCGPGSAGASCRQPAEQCLQVHR